MDDTELTSLEQLQASSDSVQFSGQRLEKCTAELLRLADWLQGDQVTHVAMEATEVYRKPVWHVLEEHRQVVP